MPSKLAFALDFDFQFFGIVCAERPYRLAWLLNECFQWDFIRQPDLEVGMETSTILFVCYRIRQAHSTIFLLKNKGRNSLGEVGYFQADLKDYDYFLVFKEPSLELGRLAVLKKLGKIPSVLLSGQLPTTSLVETEGLVALFMAD